MSNASNHPDECECTLCRVHRNNQHYTPVDGDAGLCANCDEFIGMHYQSAEGVLWCVPVVPVDLGERRGFKP